MITIFVQGMRRGVHQFYIFNDLSMYRRQLCELKRAKIDTEKLCVVTGLSQFRLHCENKNTENMNRNHPTFKINQFRRNNCSSRRIQGHDNHQYGKISGTNGS